MKRILQNQDWLLSEDENRLDEKARRDARDRYRKCYLEEMKKRRQLEEPAVEEGEHENEA